MLDPLKNTSVDMFLRSLAVKREKGSEETYIVTMDLESVTSPSAKELNGVLLGSEGALAAMEAAGSNKAKGKLEYKGDSGLLNIRFGTFDTDSNFEECLRGKGRIILNRLKYTSDGSPELSQRVRLVEFSPSIDEIGRLFRRMNRELWVEVQPAQLSLLDQGPTTPTTDGEDEELQATG